MKVDISLLAETCGFASVCSPRNQNHKVISDTFPQVTEEGDSEERSVTVIANRLENNYREYRLWLIFFFAVT